MAINLNHGNRLRPPDEAYERKKQRSSEAYAKSKLANNPYWLNEKILRENYNLYGDQPLDLIFLSEHGFDFKLVNQKLEVAGETVFIMNKFGYSFVNNKSVKILKMY
jgi:hypothetical protein